jgi:hypothetical protein
VPNGQTEELSADSFRLFGYLELLNEEQRAQFNRSMKIIKREAAKIAPMIHALYVEGYEEVNDAA